MLFFINRSSCRKCLSIVIIWIAKKNAITFKVILDPLFSRSQWYRSIIFAKFPNIATICDWYTLIRALKTVCNNVYDLLKTNPYISSMIRNFPFYSSDHTTQRFEASFITYYIDCLFAENGKVQSGLSVR